MSPRSAAVLLSASYMSRWKNPRPSDGSGKESRGEVLILAGSSRMPGAAVLAANAALRAGAGKLQIVTAAKTALGVGIAVPEALVQAAEENAQKGLRLPQTKAMNELIDRSQAILIGPGLEDPRATLNCVKRVVGRQQTQCLVIDAQALSYFADRPAENAIKRHHCIITPHSGEMAWILNRSTASVLRNRPRVALEFAANSGAITVLKGEETFIASPDGKLYVNRRGNPGLGISGSGDLLAGLIAGFAARGATPLQAAAWGVFAHATAGDRLAKKLGPLGYLPRELLAEIPQIMARYH